MQEGYGHPGADPTCEPGEDGGTSDATVVEPQGEETDGYGSGPPSDPPPGGGSGGIYDYGNMEGDPPPSGDF
jgi:hypothetical protein